MFDKGVKVPIVKTDLTERVRRNNKKGSEGRLIR